jgi:hypothetical protein
VFHGKVPTPSPSSTREGLAQSQRGTTLASHLSPTGPALRANPFPEVTDLICRLPLPTLFYRLEAIHLGDLLRMWVRSGRKIITPSSDFQGSARAHRTPQEPWRFAGTTTLSRVEPIPGCPSLKKKRKLFPGLSLTSPSSFALPRLDSRRNPFSLSRLGNFNPIPFRSHASVHEEVNAACFRKAFAYLLGSTDPCATAVHMEPFSTSVFKHLT